MTGGIEPTAAAFLDLVDARTGHFSLESGHHSGLWLDLDNLFASPRPLEPFVARLTAMLRTHAPEIVCGPLVGGAFLAQLVSRELDAEFCYTERAIGSQEEVLYRA